MVCTISTHYVLLLIVAVLKVERTLTKNKSITRGNSRTIYM